jgi:hypothetical protein
VARRRPHSNSALKIMAGRQFRNLCAELGLAASDNANTA